MKSTELKAHRENLGHTQISIARELGVSERYYLYRERGDKPIPPFMAYAVLWLAIGRPLWERAKGRKKK